LFSTSYDQIRDKSTHGTKCTIFKKENVWKIETQNENISEKLILATGSNPKIWEMLQSYGHAVVNPVPSLFTFNIKDARIKNARRAALATVK
jgi:predicted flavoprotein YhiN